MTSSSTHPTSSTEQTEERNPLDCLRCNSVIKCPIRLACQHYFCRTCVAGQKCCPICRKPINSAELCEDKVLNYVVESSREFTETCANCDQTSQPMYFCDTCHQPLCTGCRATTHKAKIFSTHNIVELEERGRLRNRPFCAQHNEPFILFCLDSKSLMCIECFNSSSLEKRGHFVNIEVAHKICCDKLEKNALNLRIFQDELREQIELRKRLMVELDKNGKLLREEIEQKCDQIVGRVNELRHRLLAKVAEETSDKQRQLASQLEELCCLESPVSVNLLSVSIFCSYASKMDVLHCYADLHKAILQFLSSNGRQLIQKVKLDCNFSIDFLHEFNQSICQPLGCSSLFPSFGDAHDPANDGLFNINCDPTRTSSPSTVVMGQSLGGCQTSTFEKPSIATVGLISASTSKADSGNDSMMANNSSVTDISADVVKNGLPKSELRSSSVDGQIQNNNNIKINNIGIGTAEPTIQWIPSMGGVEQRFQEQFQAIARPLNGFAQEISAVSKTLHDLQRDLTQRRCVVSPEELIQKIANCEDAWGRLETHNKQVEAVVNHHLKQLWRRELERIQRQQMAVREKARELVQLRALAKRAMKVSQQLKPFATQMASLISVIDVRRTGTVLPSPMEQLCSEITQIEPDSQSRVAAIEKEEASRRAAKLEEEKCQLEGMEGLKARRALREVRPPTPKMHKTQIVLIETDSRERGGIVEQHTENSNNMGETSKSSLSSPGASKKRQQRRLHRSSDGATCNDMATATQPSSSSLILELYERDEAETESPALSTTPSIMEQVDGMNVMKKMKDEEEEVGMKKEEEGEEKKKTEEGEEVEMKKMETEEEKAKMKKKDEEEAGMKKTEAKEEEAGVKKTDAEVETEMKKTNGEEEAGMKKEEAGMKRTMEAEEESGMSKAEADEEKNDEPMRNSSKKTEDSGEGEEKPKASASSNAACAQVTRGRDPGLLQAREKLLESIREKVKRID